jgi:RNA polymerase sigma-70 factor (ECF subfamily)
MNVDMEFDTLVRRHKDAVYRQMVRMCGNPDDAEDVLAESLLNAYKAMHQLSDPDAFQGWLAIIARRTCGRLRKREQLHPVLQLSSLQEFGFDPAGTSGMPEQELLEAETKSCIVRVISSMPEIYRDVYTRRDVEGLSAKETADALGITEAAVKSRLHRARAYVRDHMDASLQPI